MDKAFADEEVSGCRISGLKYAETICVEAGIDDDRFLNIGRYTQEHVKT